MTWTSPFELEVIGLNNGSVKSITTGKSMNTKIMRVGLDLAKSIFVVYGVDEHGKCQLRRSMRRAEVLTFFVKLSSRLVGVEAGSDAHYWARELIESQFRIMSNA